MSQTGRHHVIVIGDAFVDIMAKVDRLPMWGGDTESNSIQQMAGGSALNVAVHLGEILKAHNTRGSGTSTASFFGLVGDDAFGKVLRKRLADSAVGDAMLNSRDQGTGVCIVLSGPEDRGFVTQIGATGQLGVEHLGGVSDIVRSAENDSVSVHVSGFYSCHALQPDLAEFLRRVRREAEGVGKKLTVSLDTNCDASGEWGGGVLDILCEVDVFLPNETEALGIAKGAHLEAACDFLAGRVRGCCVTTCGKDGCILQTREAHDAGRAPVVYTAPKGISPVDATGAGDAFDSGFLYKMSVCGSSLEESIRYASCAGALCTQSFGANDVPITAEGVEAILAAAYE